MNGRRTTRRNEPLFLGFALLAQACTLTADSFEPGERAPQGAADEVVDSGLNSISAVALDSRETPSSSQTSPSTQPVEQEGVETPTSSGASGSSSAALSAERDAAVGETIPDGGTTVLGPDAGGAGANAEGLEPLDAGANAANVLSSDAGSPSCTSQILNDSCYEFFVEELSFAVAQQRCVTWGGDLAFVQSEEEDQLLAELVELAGIAVGQGGGGWIGARDAVENDVFVWEDGSPLDFRNFAQGQPNDGAGIQCLEKRNRVGGGWADRGCGTELRYFCERPL